MRRLAGFATAILVTISVLLLSPHPVRAQAKSLEPIKIGYSGIGIAHASRRGPAGRRSRHPTQRHQPGPQRGQDAKWWWCY